MLVEVDAEQNFAYRSRDLANIICELYHATWRSLVALENRTMQLRLIAEDSAPVLLSRVRLRGG